MNVKRSTFFLISINTKSETLISFEIEHFQIKMIKYPILLRYLISFLMLICIHHSVNCKILNFHYERKCCESIPDHIPDSLLTECYHVENFNISTDELIIKQVVSKLFT